jgi:hypothetical protein
MFWKFSKFGKEIFPFKKYSWDLYYILKVFYSYAYGHNNEKPMNKWSSVLYLKWLAELVNQWLENYYFHMICYQMDRRLNEIKVCE